MSLIIIFALFIVFRLMLLDKFGLEEKKGYFQSNKLYEPVG